MKRFDNTQELKEWFDEQYSSMKVNYIHRRKNTLNRTLMIEKSIAYHTINSEAIKGGYELTECQINKLVPLLMAEEMVNV